MPDVEFDDLGQCRDRLGSGKVQAVAGMDLKAEAPSQLRAMADAPPFGLCGRHPVLGNGVAPRAGMNLDHWRTEGNRRLDLPWLSGDEQRDANAGAPQSGHDRGDCVLLAGYIEAALSRAFFATLRYETGGVRPGMDRDPNHLFGRYHLQIERFCDLRLEAGNVIVADMAPVFTQMRSNAVGAGIDGDLRRLYRIRVASAAGVTDGSDVIDIDAEAKVRSRHSWLPSGRAAGSSPCLQACTRSACATTSFARNCAMIELRCLISNTSRSIVTDVKSGDDRSILILSMLPSCSAMTWATCASDPGSLTV